MPYVNTYEEIGEQETLDRLVSNTLTSFTDDRVRYIGMYAFNSSTALEELHLPKCYYLMTECLLDAKNLKKIILDLNTGRPCGAASRNVISDANSARVVIYVPDELVDAYKDPETREFNNWNGSSIRLSLNPWAEHADRIYGISKIGGTQEWLEHEIADSWETIGAHISAGDAAETYHLGMYKPVDLGSEGIINFQIVGLNQDTISGTNSIAQLTWCAMEPLGTRQRMNPAKEGDTMGTGTNGGWPYCSLRTYLSNTILPLFPSNVSALIKSVDKVSKVYDPTIAENDKFLDASSVDKLFLFSDREVCLPSSASAEGSGPRYIFGFSSYASRMKPSQNPNNWWLRSVSNSVSGAYFEYISNNGGYSAAVCTDSINVIFGFCT